MNAIVFDEPLLESLVVGSVWKDEADVTQKLSAHLLANRYEHHIFRNTGGTFSICCSCVSKGKDTVTQMREKCSFELHCRVKTSEATQKKNELVIKRCCLTHSCVHMNMVASLRKRNPVLSVLERVVGSLDALHQFAEGAEKDGARRRAPILAVQSIIKSRLGISMGRRPLEKYWQEKKGDTFRHYMEEMFILEEVLEKCKLSDPEGMYELEVKELSYRVEGDVDENDENEEEISKMFFRLHVMPSASKHWWKHCRKIMSADAAHLRGQLDNVVNMLTAKDANDQNFTLMYTICGNEDGANFHSTLSRASAALGNDITVLVSDRIMTVEKEMQQDQLQGCVFTHCALHIAKNTGITKSEAITIITKMAKS